MTMKPSEPRIPRPVEISALAIGSLILFAAALLSPLDSIAVAQQGSSQDEEESGVGLPVEHAATVSNCVRCHAMDDAGRMTRISYERKTPEGWQQTIRRMVLLNDVELEPEVARDIVRYLADEHGLAPEEARPGFFEAERRVIDFDYEDDDTEVLCISATRWAG